MRRGHDEGYKNVKRVDTLAKFDEFVSDMAIVSPVYVAKCQVREYGCCGEDKLQVDEITIYVFTIN